MYDTTVIQFVHKFGATSQFKGVHDKIGHVAKDVVHRREKDGLSRAYTAFMFYGVLLEHLKKPVRVIGNESKWDKPYATATRYITLYAAGSADDAIGKDPAKINMILDRSMMWDARPVNGCQSAFTFYNGNFNARCATNRLIVYNMMLQRYPCPSTLCPCATSHVVDRLEFEPVALCRNVRLVGPLDFKNARLKQRKFNDVDGTAVAIPTVDEAVVLENLIIYLQTMFCDENYVPPYGMIPS